MKIIIAKDVLEQAEKYYEEQTTKKKLTHHESYVKYKKSHVNYYKNNKDKIKQNYKKYLELNLSGYCEICKLNYNYLNQHYKTNKHINNLNN